MIFLIEPLRATAGVVAAASIHSIADFKRYSIMFLVYLRVKMQGAFNTAPRLSAIPNGPTAFGGD